MMETLLGNPHRLIDHIRAKILTRENDKRFFTRDGKEETDAAVLFLLGMRRPISTKPPEPCLIFTQRSRNVRQPGDLCFPGGGISPKLDRLLACFLKLPGFPLFHRPSIKGRTPERTATSHSMATFLATSLRESFEEMRLNPLRVSFLGPMAPEFFTLFKRTIYPMVAWTCGQKRFILNREVERIVSIPLRHFLHHSAYSRFRLSASMPDQPCITYQNDGTRDLLWGITYRIVMRFLDVVFNFQPPDTPILPLISKQTGGNRP
jgi:8-oxo-dGTP pyrophosphatase MutT (NUDIX family)